MNDKKEKRPRLTRYIAIGMLLGLSLGAGMKNIPAGMGIGLALGMIFTNSPQSPTRRRTTSRGKMTRPSKVIPLFLQGYSRDFI
ncbi:MAG TPA: hypothetical protein H9969_06905 [Candidatus Barnesiella merdipullorum]|nr:hypothetical protein [Candidatus Barnesiella merdipullorum]